MRFIVFVGAASALVACAKADKPADTTTPAAAAPAPAAQPAAQPAAISLADVAGTWTVVGKDATTDSTLATYTLKATADTSGWTVTFPNRPAVAMRVISVSGDSIVTETAEYESVLRKGVKVKLNGVSRLKDGKLVGTAVAHYSVKTADSVRTIRMEGTRAP